MTNQVDVSRARAAVGVGPQVDVSRVNVGVAGGRVDVARVSVAAASSSSNIRVWNGTSFVQGQIVAWDGSSYVYPA